LPSRRLRPKEKPQLQISCGWGFGFAGESFRLHHPLIGKAPAQPHTQQQLQQQTAGVLTSFITLQN
jgi:hypothetical protein